LYFLKNIYNIYLYPESFLFHKEKGATFKKNICQHEV